MIDSIREFVYKYYINPFISDTSYNVFDTLTYAIILGISVFAIIKLLARLKIDIDERLVYSVTPYILAGSAMRVMEDAGTFQPPLQYLFITPAIYFPVFIITFACLFVSARLYGRDYHRAFFFMGAIWAAVTVALLFYGRQVNIAPGAYILSLGTVISLAVYFIAAKTGFRLLTDKVNAFLLFAHLLDASSTFVGVDILGYYEKHVVPTFFIGLTGTAAVMFVLKLAVFIPVLYILDRELSEDSRMRNFLKLVILVLGFSPAFRNTMRMMLGV